MSSVPFHSLVIRKSHFMWGQPPLYCGRGQMMSYKSSGDVSALGKVK